jgi:hypothetical protein
MVNKPGDHRPKEHESPLRFLEDIASIFAGKRVGLEASLLLYGVVIAALAGIIWTAVHR